MCHCRRAHPHRLTIKRQHHGKWRKHISGRQAFYRISSISAVLIHGICLNCRRRCPHVKRIVQIRRHPYCIHANLQNNQYGCRKACPRYLPYLFYFSPDKRQYAFPLTDCRNTCQRQNNCSIGIFQHGKGKPQKNHRHRHNFKYRKHPCVAAEHRQQKTFFLLFHLSCHKQACAERNG